VIFPWAHDLEKVTSLSVSLGLRRTPRVDVPDIEKCENYWHFNTYNYCWQKKNNFQKIKSMQHVLVASQWEKSSSYSILILVISLFTCPLPWMSGAIALVAPPLCTPLRTVHLKLFTRYIVVQSPALVSTRNSSTQPYVAKHRCRHIVLRTHEQWSWEENMCWYKTCLGPLVIDQGWPACLRLGSTRKFIANSDNSRSTGRW